MSEIPNFFKQQGAVNFPVYFNKDFFHFNFVCLILNIGFCQVFRDNLEMS